MATPREVNIAQALRLQDRIAEARPHFEKAIAYARELGERSVLAKALLGLADMLQEDSQPPKAEPLFVEAAQLFVVIGQPAIAGRGYCARRAMRTNAG